MEGRGSFRRRLESLDPQVVDVALAVGLAAITLVELSTSLDCPCVTPADAWWTAFFMLMQTLPLALRRRYPFAVMNVVGISAIVYDLLPLDPDPNTAILAVLLALYSVSAYARRPLAVAAAIVTGVALVVLNLPAIADEQDLGDVVSQFLLLGGAWIVGDNTRYRRREAELLRERAERAEWQREERVRVAALEERSRLAREIHDVIAHSVSVIAVQAGTARAVSEQRPDRARDALASIERLSKEAMIELRRALGVLRAPGDEAALTPTPGLSLLEDLVEKVRRAGLSVDLAREGEPRAVPPGVDLCAYRIVQEALTNTVKHAGTATARVTISFEAEWLDVVVTDEAPASTVRSEPNGDGSGTTGIGGQGLIGMRERVALVGGTFEAGATDTGFAVRARFPLDVTGRSP